MEVSTKKSASLKKMYGQNETYFKTEWIDKLCKRLSSNSVGVRVCMLSRKMWHKLVDSAGKDEKISRMQFVKLMV